MLRGTIRFLTGYSRDVEAERLATERLALERAEHEAATAHYPPIPWQGRDVEDAAKPYRGWPVPEGVSLDPDAKFLAYGWNDAWDIAPAGHSEQEAVVFHHDYLAETDRGEVVYEEDCRRDVEGSGEPGAWLGNIVAVHERLEEGRGRGQGRGEQGWKRVVRFRGATCSSYRLERLPSGIFDFAAPLENDDDAVLALHQRWAMQYLSACIHIHSKGIVLNAPIVEDSLWLRADFSLVVAGFVAASCAQLAIPGWHWESGDTLISPFGRAESRDFRADLFNWACWVYELMTGLASPVVDRETLWMWDGPERCRLEEEKRGNEEAVEKGRFDNWPVLRDEELGSCLVKAWKGEYGSAEEALGDVRSKLEGCGRVLVDGEEDEIGGFDWQAEFEYDPMTMQISRSLAAEGSSA